MKNFRRFFWRGALIAAFVFVISRLLYAQYYGDEGQGGGYYSDYHEYHGKVSKGDEAGSLYYANNTQNNPYGASKDSRYQGDYSRESVNNPYAPEEEPVFTGNTSSSSKIDRRDPRRLIDNPYDTTMATTPYGEFGSPYDPDRVYNPYADYKTPFGPPDDMNPYVSEVPIVFSGNAGNTSTSE